MGDTKATVAAIAAGYTAEDAHNTAGMVLDACKRMSRAVNPLTAASSPLARMDGAARLYAQITGVEFEEPSRRYIVSFTVVGGETGEIETVRTDRVDGRYGEVVERMLGRDKAALKGKRAVIYKTSEEMRGAPGRTVRIAPFIDILD